MARVVGIICEYNPFHLGHKYQIDEIKREVPDAKIVAIMSGNATQRASLAIFEKHKRAEAALNLGADLVLELPFPYSSSCAEIFAEGGVSIAEKIGCDYLYFGTEKAKVSDLYDACNVLASPEFEVRIREHLQNKRESYITAREKALSDLGFSVKLEANDMLALEYVRAIKKMGAKIEIKNAKSKIDDTLEETLPLLISDITADLVNNIQDGVDMPFIIQRGILLAVMAIASLCCGGIAAVTCSKASAGFAKTSLKVSSDFFSCLGI